MAKMKQDMVNQNGIIKRYRKMINELNSKLKEKVHNSVTQSPSRLDDIPQNEVLLDSPSIANSPMKQSFRRSSTLGMEDELTSTIQQSKLRFSLNVLEPISITNKYSFKKFIEIRRVNSIEPALRNLIECKSLYELLHSTTIQVKKLIACKS
jgi:hypothetical protein